MNRLLAAALLICSCFEVKNALPDFVGQTQNRASTLDLSTTVWVSLGLEVFLCAVFLAVPFIARIAPSAVHFGSRRLSDYSPAQLDRVIPVVSRMMGALCVLVTFFVGLGVHLRIEQARNGNHTIAPLLIVNGAMLVSLIVVTFVYGEQMDQAAGEH